VSAPPDATVAEKFHAELHERAGHCGHCGKRKCPGRKQHSVLPDKLKTDDVLAAMEAASGERP
jgi:hypothetical protein